MEYNNILYITYMVLIFNIYICIYLSFDTCHHNEKVCFISGLVQFFWAQIPPNRLQTVSYQ